jgi:voltage-gated potassium channel
MERTREWVSVRASVALTFAVALLSIVVGLLHISGFSVQGPLSPYIPEIVRRTVGFTGTITGFTMLGSGFALRRGYRVGWRSAAVLLPLTAIQGLLQVSVFSLPLVVLSLVSAPALVINRGRFDRQFSPSPTQLAAAAALAAAISYGTLGSYALRDEFGSVDTLVDAFYFTVVTASTVGYGDVTPDTQIAKLFVLSSLVMNVAAFAVALGVLLTPAIEAQLSKALGKMTEKQFDLLDGHVLVLGTGDLTEPILEELAKRDGVEHAVVTTDETAARRLDERSVPVLTADPSDVEPLHRAHIEDARAVVVATDDDARDALAILTARQLNPDVRIVAAVTQRENIDKLRRAGADQVISPATLGGHILIDCAFGENGDSIGEIADDAFDSGSE